MDYWALALVFFLIYIYTATQKTQGPLHPNHPQLQNGVRPILKQRWQHASSSAMLPNDFADGRGRQNGVFD